MEFWFVRLDLYILFLNILNVFPFWSYFMSSHETKYDLQKVINTFFN